MRIITRTIWILSLVSLFTDLASEMLYPVIPVYLQSIHFSIFMIGILEGVAEATAGLSKGYFGKLSDNTGRRLPFVQWGYALSALSKPMMAFFAHPVWIFTARTTDRLGKGIRTGARDALLSAEATKETKATVFGFHRSMDTFGAVLGPLAALIFLYFYPGQYITLFYIAFIPGVVAILFTLLVREKKTLSTTNTTKTSFFDFIKYWKNSPTAYRRLVTGLLLFTLFNSSDVFLLLKLKDAGLSDSMVIGVYIFYNLVYALCAYPIGIIADKLGLGKVFITGLLLFSIVYGCMGFGSGIYFFLVVFALYGIYAAFTEGIAKAWITNISGKDDTATAVGTFTAFQSIAAMFASSFAGLIWLKFGATATFVVAAVGTVFVLIYFLINNKATAPAA